LNTGRDRRLTLAAVLACLGFVISFAAAVRPLRGDGKNYGLVARSLLADGDIRLDEFSATLTGNTLVDGGHVYNFFPLGPSLLIAPLYPAARLLTHEPARAETLAARAAAASCFGAALGLLYLLARRFAKVSGRQAFGLALLFGFCSLQLPTHVSGLASHGAAVPFVLAALFALTSPLAAGPALAGLLLVAAYVMRPTAGVLLPLVAGFLWFERRRALSGFVAAVLLLGTGVVWMNLSLYGHAVPPYNRVTRLVLADLPHGLLGNLVSPSRGLLFYCPWCVFSAAGGVLALTRREVPAFFRLLAAVFSVHLAVIACFPQWWAGWCYGPRFLAEMMPELVLLLIPALAALEHATARLRRRATGALAATIGYSFLVAILGTTHSGGHWNDHPNNVDLHPERLWDWSDPQIVRALRVALTPSTPR
jgi:hypothetical protein